MKKPNPLQESKAAISFRILPENQIVYASHGQSILEALLKAKIDIDHSCGGMGTCGTCRIEVVEGLGQFGERSELEQEIANDRGFKKEERLSCQNEACPGIVLKKSY